MQPESLASHSQPLESVAPVCLPLEVALVVMKSVCLVIILISSAAVISVADLPPQCRLPLETGPCRALFMRFGFNPSRGACQQFTYGGCRGNGNNFKSERECRETCSPASG